MARGGRNRSDDEPERRCIVSGKSGARGGLVRFVVGPGDEIVPDILGRLPGRGLWVTADRSMIAEAAGKNRFARAARKKVTIPADLPDRVEALLLRRVVDLIAMARKGGKAVTGYEKVKGWLLSEQAEVLIQASDGSERGKTKLRPPEGGRRAEENLISCLTAEELGLAFGRDRAIHAALAPGGLTTRIIDEATRLAGLRQQGGQNGNGIAGKDKLDG